MKTAETFHGCFTRCVLFQKCDGWNKTLFYFCSISVLFQLWGHYNSEHNTKCTCGDRTAGAWYIYRKRRNV